MTIGNFHLPANTNAQYFTSETAFFGAYYYIDDVRVTDCTVGVEELTIDNEELIIYPNPATSQLIIDNGKLKIKEVKIYNVLGECLHQQPITNNQQLTIGIEGFVQGIYFIEAQTDGSASSPQGKGLIRKKFVKQ